MGAPPQGTSYGYFVGGIFIFNLVLGTGCLALPYGWNYGGMGAGILLTLLIFLFAYICATFIVEAISHAHALGKYRERKSINDSQDNQSAEIISINDPNYREDFNDSPSTAQFDVSRIELGAMSEVFLGVVGRWFFYLLLLAYLFGDLAIYAVAVPQSVLNTLTPNGIDFPNIGISIGREVTYWIFLTIYAVVVAPFCFSNFANTKYLQYFTIICRNVAMFLMIAIGIGYIVKGEGSELNEIDYFNPAGLATLWGTILYCFMCHHSIPGMVSPLKDKHQVNILILIVYIFLLAVFCLLAGTGVLAFGTNPNTSCSEGPCELQTMYTSNFLYFHIKIVGYLLGLYPVFTISTNFPLIAITLRNNILSIFNFGENDPKWQKYRSPIATIITIVPPILVAGVFTNVSALVSITGSYAGLGIEFIIPSVLVYYSRKEMKKVFNNDQINRINPYKSPFRHTFWIIIILVTAIISLAIVTLNNIFTVINYFTDNEN